MSEPPASRQRLLEEWRNRVRAEYGSAGLAAQATHWMIRCGFPSEEVEVGLRIVSDELAHARLSHDVVVAMGGADEPMAVDIRATAAPVSPHGVLTSLTNTILRNFCLGETFAVPLFRAMRETTTQPTALTALDRVLRDEAVHRAFGWQSLDTLLTYDADGIRQHARSQLPTMLAWFERAYTSSRQAVPLTEEERSCGLISGSEYATIFHTCLHEQIVPRFQKRGISLG